MMTLLIKDWRLNRPVTIAWLIIFLALPITTIMVVATERRQYPAYDYWPEVVDAAISGILAGLGTASIIVPAFGAISFARERRDRSADFLASMPVQRVRVVASKGVVTLFLCILPWIGALSLLSLIRLTWPSLTNSMLQHRTGEDQEFFRVLAHLQILLLGLSWMLSSIVRSEVLAASVSVLGTIILCVAWGMFAERMYYRGPEFHAQAVQLGWNGSLSIGIVGLVVGTVVALRRTSP